MEFSMEAVLNQATGETDAGLSINYPYPDMNPGAKDGGPTASVRSIRQETRRPSQRSLRLLPELFRPLR